MNPNSKFYLYYPIERNITGFLSLHFHEQTYISPLSNYYYMPQRSRGKNLQMTKENNNQRQQKKTTTNDNNTQQQQQQQQQQQMTTNCARTQEQHFLSNRLFSSRFSFIYARVSRIVRKKVMKYGLYLITVYYFYIYNTISLFINFRLYSFIPSSFDTW